MEVLPTAQLVSAALEVLPAPPDGAVVVNYKGERYDDANFDLFLYDGRVDREWREAWRSTPLVLHDAGVVAEIHALITFTEYLRGQKPDVFSIFTRALKDHPGPVACLRLDSSECPPPALLASWLETLACKDGGVGQLVIVNITRTGESFPLDLLPGPTSSGGGIRSLALGFFAVSPYDARHLFCCIAELTLTACTFRAEELSYLVSKLRVLESLVLGLCDLGCGQQAGGTLYIFSHTLTRLRMRKCTGSAVTIRFAPSLVYFETGIHPRNGDPRRLVDIDLGEFSSSLHELDGLAPWHDLYFDNPRYIYVRVPVGPPPAAGLPPQTKRRRLTVMPSLGTLKVLLEMSTPSQTESLVELLQSLPRLTHLTICRMDDVRPEGDEEAEAADASTPLESVPCITGSLTHLVMQQFRGGTREVGFASGVLASGRQLVSLTLTPNSTLPQEQVAESFAILLACPRASRNCQVALQGDADPRPT